MRKVLQRTGLALGLLAIPALASAQKALVYCPIAQDRTGCDAIVAALIGPAYPGGVDRGHDGTGGTVDLRMVDLSTYEVFLVPSLADDPGSQPYAFLRDPTVAAHLKSALIGGLAVWSGMPDQGSANRAQKDQLIRNLAAWAGANQASADGPGLVAFLDLSDDEGARYDWLRAITPFRVTSDVTLISYDSVRALTPTATTILGAAPGQNNYASMAVFGLATMNPTPGISLDAVGSTGTSLGGQVVLVTLAAGNTGGPSVSTDLLDYGPGDTVTFTGSGWGPSEVVTLVLHEDPLQHNDRTITVVADGFGNFTDRSFAPEIHDVGVRFVVTATGGSSGSRAQTTFTDDNRVTFSNTAGGAAVSTFGSITANACRAAFAQSRQGSGLDNADANRVVLLSSTPSGATFYAGSACAGSPITSVTILSGTQSIPFSFTIGTGGAYTITGDGPFTGANDASATITVTPELNVAPTVGADNATVTATEGTTATNTGTYSDVNVAQNVTITASIGAVTKTGTNTGTWSWSLATNDNAAAQTVTITANDGAGGVTTTTFQLTINNANPVVGAVTTNTPTNQGSPATASASFTDAGTADTHTCSINWGDGNTTAGTVAAGSCSGSRTYTSDGSFTVTITVTDDDLGSGSSSATHVVNNVAPTVNTPVLTPSPSNEGQLVNLSATFTDPGLTETHTCTINWGDGSPTGPGTVAGGACTGSHTYGDNGSYSVTVTVTDDGGDAGSNTAPHLVNNVAPTVGAVTVVPQPSLEGSSATASATFTDPGANDAPFVCTVNYGDGSGDLAGTVAANSCTGPTHVYADNNSYTVTVSVKDKDNGTGSNSTSHTVNNVAPTVGAVTVSPEPSLEGGAVTGSATFTDPGTNDGPFTCTVNYGDGSGDLAGTVAGNACSGPSHVYADNNTYTVTVSVKDKDDGSGSNTGAHLVNNADPVIGTVIVLAEPSNEGSSATASASFTDAGTADTHTCSINWGDGNTSTGTVVQGAGSGSCSGTHTYVDDGSFTTTITITDDDAGSGSNSTTHVVANVAPTITNVSVAPEPSPEGNTDLVTATFTDPGTADVHTCSINWGDGSPAQTGAVAGGSCTGSHTYADNNAYTVAVTIDDGDGGSDTESTSHVVNNAPPTITAATILPEPSDEGQLVNLSASFTDPGTADTHTCTINYGDGTPTEPGTVAGGACTDSHTYADEGSFTVTVTITDDDGGADAETTTHVVNNVAPTVAQPTVAPEPSNEGQSVTASANFTDPGVNDTFTCTVNYGDGSGVQAGTVAGNTCTGPAHVYADEGTGSYTVTVAVSDNDGGTGSNSTSHVVNNVAPTVAVVTVVPKPSIEGGPVTASASFTDPGLTDTFSCTVNYGDGSGAQAGAVAGNLCTGPAHTYVDNGSFTVTIDVSDNDGGTGTNTTSHEVNNANPVVGPVTVLPEPSDEGSSVTTSASFTDAGVADTHVCSINWGDGNTTPGTVVQGAGSGSCSGTHTYIDNGSFPVTITITDDDAGPGSNSTTHLVNNVAPVVNTPVVTPEPSNEGSSVNLSASFTDVGAQDTHTCTINWGDGSPTGPGTVGSGACTGSHSYGDNGSYTVTVTVTDDDGGAGTNSTAHAVHNVAPTVGTVTASPEPSVEGGAVTASASFTDPGANEGPFTCTVNYGDGSGALAGTVSGNTCNGPSHVYADNNTHTVTIAVKDKDNGTGSNSGSHGVTNAAPAITSITGPTDPIQIGASASITATFTDAGTADTHTCSINWGDGTTTPGTVSETSGSGTCSGSHTYGAQNVYAVTVTVTDDDGGSDAEVYQEYIVIFDPNGGFVTGGGWINSPAGAYATDPSAVGKANFGFVSKYKNGATVPTGETEFQFKAGNLNFHSTSYEWMVISGAKARYRGVGTINGSGSYAFELTAWDGQVNGGGGTDRWRIRIYGVYDNMLGAPDGTDPTTALGGGSVVIHKGK